MLPPAPFPPARLRRPVPALLTALSVWAAAAGAAPQPGRAASLFQAVELDEQRLVLVAAPIGSTGARAQLHIYEQLNDRRPCYSVSGGPPSLVDPLLATFNFTGICGRYLDANGYSLRVGGSDMGTVYRLSVVRVDGDNLLLAVPTRPGAGPELVVARTQGPGTDYLQLVLEPGWRLKRRAYNGRNLGHVYFYQDDWPSAAVATDQAEPETGLEVELEVEGALEVHTGLEPEAAEELALPAIEVEEPPAEGEVRLGSDELMEAPPL